MASWIVFSGFGACSLLVMLAVAFDPSPLQDFCVADTSRPAFVNGLACKDPKKVTADDFLLSGFHISGNTSNPIGSAVKAVTASELPGLNTLGISLVRVDYAPRGVNPLHTHPRASEILTVLEGSLEVGFITSSPENRRITKVLEKGDVFVFPVGLVHYQKNVGHGNAVAIAALSSQNPGVIIIAGAVFGSNPEMSEDVLARSFQLDKNVINYLQTKF
ncbi:putative germin-like protein 2-1 [Humulus lupulus]|uniref:putative germin-like protein 2-1 n=1 Tax=Humulus lupulus TaxID=3486 RepID=UPI002B4102DC|nr:putative germin-like protein 2-1 [Humulus lupulus]